MSFLAPLFLLGGLAVGLPVVFHLIRRTSRVRTPFSSLMFLRSGPPRMTRRNRLEDLLLLALRCLVIALLALGFARPFWKEAVPLDRGPGLSRQVVALLDTSASMRRAGMWDGALERLDAVVDRLGVGDELVVWSYAGQVRPVFGFDDWAVVAPGDRQAWVRSQVAALAPGWGATVLDEALIQAADALAGRGDEAGSARREVVVISDLQEGSRLQELQGHDWPFGVEVLLEPIEARGTGNAGLQRLAGEGVGAIGSGAQAMVRVRVENASDSELEQFQVGWAQVEGGSWLGPEMEVHVPAGQSRVVSIPVPEAGKGGDRLLLRGDDEAFDNSLFLAATEPREVRVLYVGGEEAADASQPRFFLERVFRDTPLRRLTVLAADGRKERLSADLSGVALAVVTGGLSDAAGRDLAEWVRQGNTVLLAPVDLESGESQARAFGRQGWFAEDVVPAQYGMVGAIDFRHPVFQPFADTRFSDFTKIHFWRYRRIALEALDEARVLARFDRGDPFVVEMSLGQGEGVLLASGWHPGDSQLAVSTKFVPLLFSLLDWAGGAAATAESRQVGDVLGAGRPGAMRIVRPNGGSWSRGEGGGEVFVAEEPGVYRVEAESYSTPVAVNLDPRESRTAPFEKDQLAVLGVALAKGEAVKAAEERRQSALNFAELEGQQRLWRWFLLGTLGVVMLETWLAARRPSPSRSAEA